jgi:hypothetical protein
MPNYILDTRIEFISLRDLEISMEHASKKKIKSDRKLKRLALASVSEAYDKENLKPQLPQI